MFIYEWVRQIRSWAEFVLTAVASFVQNSLNPSSSVLKQSEEMLKNWKTLWFPTEPVDRYTNSDLWR